jgi:hypothetical protein
LATSAFRTADAVVDEAESASAELLATSETTALIRTASGVTVVVPEALTEIYRELAAFAGIANAVPKIRAIEKDTKEIMRRDLGFMK